MAAATTTMLPLPIIICNPSGNLLKNFINVSINSAKILPNPASLTSSIVALGVF